MKKFTLFFTALFIVAFGVKGQEEPSINVSTKWQFCTDDGNLPAYIGTGNNCRGMALGVFNGEKVLAVVTREGGNQILLLDPSDGSQMSSVNVPSEIVTGGNFAINDAAITDDGIMLVCNTQVGAGAFKVYQWDNETDDPTIVINYATVAGERYGDTFTVTGSINNGTAKVYASNGSGAGKILCWSMIENTDSPGSYIFDPTPANFSTAIQAITVGVGSNIDFLPDGSFLHRSTRNDISRISSDGTTLLSSIPDAVVPSDVGMSVRYIVTGADLTSYITYFVASPGNQSCRIFAVGEDWDLDAITDPVASTPSFASSGDVNVNRTGKIVPEVDGGKVYIYVLGTNSGIAKYEITGIELATGIKEAVNDNLDINVSGSILSVTGIVSPSITLYDISGQKIKSVANANQLQVEGLKGIYIVRVTQGNATVKTEKVFIK